MLCVATFGAMVKKPIQFTSHQSLQTAFLREIEEHKLLHGGTDSGNQTVTFSSQAIRKTKNSEKAKQINNLMVAFLLGLLYNDIAWYAICLR